MRRVSLMSVAPGVVGATSVTVGAVTVSAAILP
ncbi:hypothetical protein SAMN04488047_10652 [Tranquillimonas alkanivorans]|uniref:Uncharacterized protein n=1 Tax=Tranquillimonas alkanivorans TaxID=441119 RepID=A0A1I5Q383_9RHOB|nr:hypothetical protein SAMN04488047_10652 [Tranquillimonas alkanivorans]